MKQQVHIIGAGFTGMSLAVQLAERGFEVHVYDEKSRSGGMIESKPLDGAFVEAAAHSITRSSRMDELFHLVGLTPLTPSPASKKRFIFRHGRLCRWPLSMRESAGLVLRFLLQKVRGRTRPRERESLRGWGHRILGRAATHFLLEPAMQGIYAGDGETLSSRLLLSPLFEKKREKYRGVASFSNGLSELFAAMEKKIKEKGGQLHWGQRADLGSLQGIRIVATSAPAAAQLLAGVAPTEAKLIGSIPMADLLNVTLHYRGQGEPAFGCLIPRGEHLRVLGVLMNSSIFDRGWSVWSETWIFGGATDPKVLHLSDAAVLELIKSERKAIFARDDEPQSYQIHRWSRGLPNYNLDLERILGELGPKLLDLERQKQIYVLGNYLGGLGISKILDRSEALIERLVLNEKGWHSS